VNYPVGAEPSSVIVGDFRGIGRLDMAVTNLSGDNNVSVLLGNGDGTFHTAVNYPVGMNPHSLAMGRFRGNLFPIDLVVVNHGNFSTNSSVSVLLGNGDGTFRSTFSYNVGGVRDADSVAVGDFRGIGRLDLAVADYQSGNVSILLGNGDGTFQPPANYVTGPNPVSVAVGDFNRDGRLDLVVANRSNNTVSLLLGNGNGSFQAPVSYATGTGPFGIAVGDFNRDGNLDLAVANRGTFPDPGSVSVLLGNGNGTFRPAVTYSAGMNPWSVAVGDFDDDGNPDLAVANESSNNVSLLQGNGNGTFQTAVNYAAGTNPFSVAVGDFNRDGFPDLVVANRGSSNVSVLLNQPGDTTHFGVTPSANPVTAGVGFSLTVTALTAAGTTDPSYRGTVTFSSTDGQAMLPANYLFTAADMGVHTFTGVVLRTAGNQMVTARDTVFGTITGSAPVTVTPAAASTLALSDLPPSVTAGVPATVTVTARDPFGNTATGYRGSVTFGSTDGQATLPANYPFTAADAGVHTFTNGVVLQTAGNQIVTARDTMSGTIMGSTTATVVPAAASTLVLSGLPANITAGVPFNLTVTAIDPFGNTATGYRGTVTFSSTDGQATLPANYPFTAADAGVHTFSGVTLFTAGSQTITATDTVSGINGSATTAVTPASADHFQVSAPGTVPSGNPFDVTVTAQDPYGNTDTNYTGTVTFSSSDPDPNVVLPPDYPFTASDGGTHTFAGGFTLVTAGDQLITATDTVSGITGNVTVTVTTMAAGPRDRVLLLSTTVTVDSMVPGAGSHGLVEASQPGRLPGSVAQASEPPRRQVVALDWWFASLNKRDVGFILAQPIHHTHAEADWWALDP
jgi:hypothetical protein